MGRRIAISVTAVLVILAIMPGNCLASNLARDSSSGIYIVQQTGVYAEDVTVVVMLAFADTPTSTGWGRAWGRPAHEFLASISADPSGNALICGRYRILPYEEYAPTPGFILKFSNSGDLLWARDLHWSNFSIMLNDITSDPSNNIYVTGQAWKYDSVPQLEGWHAVFGFIFTAKLDPSGEVVWAKRWNTDVKDMPSGEAVVSNGNQVVVAGYYDNDNSGQSDTVMLWYDAFTGNLTGTTSYGFNTMYLRPVEMTYDPSGNNVYVVGGNSGETDVILLKYSSGGFLQFAQGWGNNDLNNAYDISVAGDSVFVSGSQQTGSAPPDNTGYEAPLYDGLVLEYAGDILVGQVTCVDDGSNEDTEFSSILARTIDDVYLFGKGPVDDEQAFYPEAEGISWYLQGNSGAPTALEDENCGSNSFAIELAANTPMSFKDFMGYCDNRRIFVGRVEWDEPANVPDTRVTADVTSGPAPLTVNFDASSTTVPYGAITNYSWDFNIDDGLQYGVDSGLSATTQFTFTEPGTYTVAVNATSDDGTKMPTTIHIRVTQ